jgi:predicted  nucleic acid-binding Zn-ribbon protein
MTEQRRTALKELQNLDLKILEAQRRIRDFDPLLIEAEESALVLESDAEKTRTRLKEMKLEERRLVASVDEKRAREKRLDERLGSVRNLREEAAVSAELEMIKRALQADEQEAYTLIDQIRKTEERLEGVDETLVEERLVVEPKLAELIAERTEAKKGLESFESERESFVGAMDVSELRLYDGIRRGGRSIAVADLTQDGACGHCFGVVPLQVQNEILHGDTLIRCEGCGVIHAAPDLEAIAAAAAEEAAREEAAKAAKEAAAADAVVEDASDAAEADEAAAAEVGDAGDVAEADYGAADQADQADEADDAGEADAPDDAPSADAEVADAEVVAAEATDAEAPDAEAGGDSGVADEDDGAADSDRTETEDEDTDDK